jgi:hypothetical protein
LDCCDNGITIVFEEFQEVDSFCFQSVMALVLLLIFFYYYYSVALAVDNPELFNRIAETFSSKAAPRFVILLWGEKSSLTINVMEGIPIFNYKEIIDLGRESRKAFFDSGDASKLISLQINMGSLCMYDVMNYQHASFYEIFGFIF